MKNPETSSLEALEYLRRAAQRGEWVLINPMGIVYVRPSANAILQELVPYIDIQKPKDTP